jgi:hypothetical protein
VVFNPKNPTDNNTRQRAIARPRESSTSKNQTTTTKISLQKPPAKVLHHQATTAATTNFTTTNFTTTTTTTTTTYFLTEQNETSTTSATATTPKQNNKNLTHFVFHIPKTGATYAHATLVQLIQNHPNWKALPNDQKFQPCNQAQEPIEHFDSHYNEVSKFNKIKCNSWMSEVPFSDKPLWRYTIVRDPTEHVVSQYFHCTESRSHAIHAQRMPRRLIIWLNLWVTGFHDDPINSNSTIEADPLRLDAAANNTKMEKRLMCYNPINLQSYFTQFNALVETPNDLMRKYHVIGDMAQIDKTICAIMIHMTGGWIPYECNCSTINNDKNNKDILQQQQTKQANGTIQQKVLFRKYDPNLDNHAHGVQHHGATYNTTIKEDEAIAKLTRYDQALYEMAKRVFAKQVSQIEATYQIKICDTFRVD